MSDPSQLASRRAVLAAGVASLASVAGCSALPSRSATLDVTLFNHTDSPYTVELSLFRVGKDLSRSDARADSESIDVEPQGETRREDVAVARQYVVQYEVYENNRDPTDEDHVHFYPSDDGDDALAFDVHAPGVLTRR
ncbi:hypothetical protein [Halobacterium noricense]|uniref:hypothetical protein n=1 Tax=Halobacterium noricense TaxID=223182 RepID=UPI001E4B5729|nr:hypothetical protein [Halobacterium noricense]UHH25381.1 hypothetical protein LT974_00170 [Halobacterium noricense]